MTAVVMKNWEPLVSLPALAIPASVSSSLLCNDRQQQEQHTQKALAGVPYLEVLILELVAVDRLATSA